MAYTSLGTTTSNSNKSDSGVTITIKFDVAYEEFDISASSNDSKIRIKLTASVTPTSSPYWRTTDLTKSTVSINNTAYKLSDGALYDASGQSISSLPSGKGWLNGYYVIVSSAAIPHLSDGSKSISIGVNNYIGGSSNRCTFDLDSFALTKIDRQASITSDINTMTINAAGSSGSTATLTISPYLPSSFSYTIQYKVGSGSITSYSPTIGTNGKFTFPYSVISGSVSSNTTLTIYCTTKSGSTTVGTRQSVDISVVKEGVQIPISFYQSATTGNTGVHIGYEATGPGLFVYGQGKFEPAQLIGTFTIQKQGAASTTTVTNPWILVKS